MMMMFCCRCCYCCYCCRWCHCCCLCWFGLQDRHFILWIINQKHTCSVVVCIANKNLETIFPFSVCLSVYPSSTHLGTCPSGPVGHNWSSKVKLIVTSTVYAYEFHFLSQKRFSSFLFCFSPNNLYVSFSLSLKYIFTNPIIIILPSRHVLEVLNHEHKQKTENQLSFHSLPGSIPDFFFLGKYTCTMYIFILFNFMGVWVRIAARCCRLLTRTLHAPRD